MKKNALLNYFLCALFAAMTALLSQIALPIGPVPINLATLSVFIAGGLLGAKYGALSQLVYVLLGAAGAPVFALLTGGLGILTGPTGGYIIGYIAAAFTTGLLAQRHWDNRFMLVLAMIAGSASCYLLGTLWFMYVTNTPLFGALGMCVIPFLPGDALKIAVAVVLVVRLHKILGIRLPAHAAE